MIFVNLLTTDMQRAYLSLLRNKSNEGFGGEVLEFIDVEVKLGSLFFGDLGTGESSELNLLSSSKIETK